MYVSTELTHFVGAKLRPDKTKQFELLIKIVDSGILSSYPDKPSNWENIAYMRPLEWTDGEFFGLAKACFCDIPFKDLAIHIAKYGEFGLAFRKDFLVQQGASPVFYVAKNGRLGSTVLGDYVKGNLESLMGLFDIRNGTNESKTQLSYFLVTRLAGYVKAFDAQRPDDDPSNYYMEREWRVHGGVRFSVGDISTIILPRGYKEEFRNRVSAFQGKFVDAAHASSGARLRVKLLAFLRRLWRWDRTVGG